MHLNTSSFSFCADTEYNSTNVANLWLVSHMRLFTWPSFMQMQRLHNYTRKPTK